MTLELIKLPNSWLARHTGKLGNCGSTWQAGKGNTKQTAINNFYKLNTN